MKYKLRKDHPFQIKVNMLFNILEEFGVGITVNNLYGSLMFIDTATGINYDLKDIEASSQDMGVSSIPPFIETKLVYEAVQAYVDKSEDEPITN